MIVEPLSDEVIKESVDEARAWNADKRQLGRANFMSIESDARFWDWASRKYAGGASADQPAYERTLGRTRALLNAGDRVLELGCGTGTTALELAGDV